MTSTRPWRLVAPAAVSSLFDSAQNLDRDLCRGLSPPFLVALPPEWDFSTHRVLIYGQETNGWAEESVPPTLEECTHEPSSIEGLRAHYEGFDFATYYSYRRSPFWAAYRQIETELEGEKRRVLWSNLIKVDAGPSVRGGTKSVLRTLLPSQVEAILDWQQNLLISEVSEVSPGAVLFLTGPRYDEVLTKAFAAQIEPVDGFDMMRLLARVISAHLPNVSFRTYHPAFLRRTRRWSVLDDIAATIKADRSKRLA